jgi:NAD(P)-dependent dehydrogenase (short-subunit alcohol dehydrogenase family)
MRADAWEAAPLLAGKRIVVTGSASGIGLETARLCASMGATVLGVDRDKGFEHVEELYRADLSDPRAVDALVGALPDGIDGLANIAGLPPTAPPGRVLAVNYWGLRRLTEGLADGGKLADGGSVVNLASLAGIGWPDALDAIRAAEHTPMEGIEQFMSAHGIGAEGGRSYFFSKEALIAWTMRDRWRWRGRGIRMNAVSPGPVETPILDDFKATLGARVEEDMRVMDRPGRPGDVAPLVAFLLSDMTRWLRGAELHADGGMASHVLCGAHGLT